MNAPTLDQRQQLADYLAARRASIHAEYLAARRAAIYTAERARDTANVCTSDDKAPPAITMRQLITAGAIWIACMAGALWLCSDAGMSFLATFWS